ncbi:Uncharacterized protein HZ326_28147 [Fusarium oxysporum f. sp. albedinis]|nr:Uncharacterized protein HZ326_28147 [Fusarium oxysporum f. sp. albedinis]
MDPCVNHVAPRSRQVALEVHTRPANYPMTRALNHPATPIPQSQCGENILTLRTNRITGRIHLRHGAECSVRDGPENW